MKKMSLILKGFIIGIAKIIPGVSGSLVALNLGLYEKGIKAISNFFKDIKNNSIFLLNVGIGILLAIILGSKLLDYLLNNYYMLTMIVFIGLLIGSNSFIKDTKTKKQYIYMITTFFIMLLLFIIKTDYNYIYKDNIINNLYVIFIGFIDAATMIIPAISGTIILMLLGSYDFFLSIFINPFSNIKILILFFIGLFIGIILVTKLMNKLLENKKEIIYPIINGFFLSSILFLSIQTLNKISTINELLISIPLLYISYKIGYKCNK